MRARSSRRRWCSACVVAAGVARRKTQLPAETKGDPKPDTQSPPRTSSSGSATRTRSARPSSRSAATSATCRRWWCWPRPTTTSASTSWRRRIIDIAKSIDPNNAECYNLLGFIALDARRSHLGDGGVQEGDRARSAATATPGTTSRRSICSRKNYDGALDAAQKATQLLPQLRQGVEQPRLGAIAASSSTPRRRTRTSGRRSSIRNYADAYFNLGILYLDAKQMPGTDLITKLNTSINYLNKYKQLAGYRLTKDDPADTYIAEARTGIDREQKRLSASRSSSSAASRSRRRARRPRRRVTNEARVC